MAEARGPMGLSKWDHIKAVGTLPRLAEQWETRYGRTFADSDVDEVVPGVAGKKHAVGQITIQ